MITDRIDAITLVNPEYQSKTPPAPKSVKIEISPRCNLRCGFCALRTRQVQPKADMDFDFFKRITQEMRDAGVEEIGAFYLGESFMNHDLLTKCVKHCKDIGFPYVFLTSNATLATAERVKAVMEAGLDSLKWSVNAADPEQYADVMGVAGKGFEQALKNIKNAYEVREIGGYKTGLYASSIAYDGEQQEKMEALIEERVKPYVDQHYWLPLYSMGSLATKREEELGYTPTAGNQGRLGMLRKPIPCWSAFTEGHVTATGNLSACCFDADARWNMGNLNEMSFMEAWHSEPFQKLREAHLKEDLTNTVCQECVAY